MYQYNNLHRQQLFNWIGRHIEKETPGHHLNDDLRVKYLDCLHGALENGLWVKTPEKPDYLWDGSLFAVDLPITCFTEWALIQSKPHAHEYGRMALGFPKRFVLSRGGQPIMYIRDGQRNAPYSNALRKVAEWFGKLPDGATETLRIQEQFRYLMHFTKRIRKPRKLPTSKPKQNAGQPKKPSKSDPFKKKFGPVLHYLEEREWRVVYTDAMKKCFIPGEDAPGRPKYYLPFKPGHDLFTVVLPDYKTVRMAIEDPELRKALHPENAPQVTILSFQDIGTF